MTHKYIMKYTLLTTIAISLIACTSYPNISFKNDNTLEVSTRKFNVGNANPVYEAIQYNGMHERTDRVELTAYVGVDPVRTEWCAAFVNAVLQESELPDNYNHKYPLTAKAFLDWGTPVDEPKAGDIVVFPRGNQGWQGHVGFYLHTEKINGIDYYVILGGNQNNKVSVKTYRANTALGIRRALIRG